MSKKITKEDQMRKDKWRLKKRKVTNQIVGIDSAELNVLLVGGDSRPYWPWLTVATNSFSRQICAMHVSAEPPGVDAIFRYLEGSL